MTTPVPNIRLGLDVVCPTCAAQPGDRCVSRTGRELVCTHDNRARTALAADPVRRWLAERREWVTG